MCAQITGLLAVCALNAEMPDASSDISPGREVARKEIRTGGHKITYVRFRRPLASQTPPASEPRPTAAADQATAEHPAAKARANLKMTVTVYLGGTLPLTELRWHDESGTRRFVAWSNVDFRHLTHFSQFETPTTLFGWFPTITSVALSSRPADQSSPFPAGLQFEPGVAEYYVDSPVAELKSEETTLDGLDYLHAFYQLHAPELKADYDHRESVHAPREQELHEHPQESPDTVIHFWPIQSRLHPH